MPFAPFGLATVSRTLQPQLPEYLLALAKSDGFDQTLVQGVSDTARQGEPYAELGMVRQQDPAWQDQTGAPRDIQAGNIPGGKRDVIRSSDFNNGSTQAFFADSGKWSVVNGSLRVEATSSATDAVAVYDVGQYLPNYYEVLATLKADKPTAGWKANAYIIFDYVSPTDYKFAGVNISTNKFEMGHRTSSGWVVDAQTPLQVKPNSTYNLMVAVNGTTATLLLDNTKLFSYAFAARVVDGMSFGLNYGMIGMGSVGAKGYFDNVAVQKLAPVFTYTGMENFDAAPSLFTEQRTGSWTTSGGYFTATPTTAPAVNFIDLSQAAGVPAGTFSISPSSVLVLETKLHSTGTAGVVFDAYGTDNYKFAAYNATTKEVVIGHVQKGNLVIDTRISRTLTAGDHTLGVTIKGTTVSVTVDTQAVLGYTFNALSVDGKMGLFAQGAAGYFDSFTVKTDDPAFTKVQAMMAAAPADAAQVGGGDVLTADSLAPIIPVAIEYWKIALQLDEQAVAGLQNLKFVVADLDGLTLAQRVGDTICLDRDAAGYGWFVDGTPEESAEFVRNDSGDLVARSDSAAAGNMDLLTVVVHEVGHVLGVPHLLTGDDAVMAPTLDAGERETASVAGYQYEALLYDENSGRFVPAAELTGKHAGAPVVDWTRSPKHPAGLPGWVVNL
ncbi:matrixin family metalloprotease [Geomonas diazotrophica]|uniref:matrixin family metalloprotease n=1 Tax=Geomonas diazotrophica TaxID=2843197 RepID=UPI001EEFB3EB|nr:MULTISPECIES: matrixin family metalloprotease [Geomonas]